MIDASNNAVVVRTPIGVLKVSSSSPTCKLGDIPKINVEFVHPEGNIPIATVEYNGEDKGVYTKVFGDMYRDEPTDIVRHDGLDLL